MVVYLSDRVFQVAVDDPIIQMFFLKKELTDLVAEDTKIKLRWGLFNHILVNWTSRKTASIQFLNAQVSQIRIPSSTLEYQLLQNASNRKSMNAEDSGLHGELTTEPSLPERGGGLHWTGPRPPPAAGPAEPADHSTQYLVRTAELQAELFKKRHFMNEGREKELLTWPSLIIAAWSKQNSEEPSLW